MKIFFYRLLQCTWGFLQTVIGAVLFLAHFNNTHYQFQGSIVTNWHGHGGSVSLGMFLFLDISHETPTTEQEKKLLLHEYGHTIQSLILGPLYLIIIGIPSFLWANCFKKYRKCKNCSYYVFYPERWANTLGLKFNRSYQL